MKINKNTVLVSKQLEPKEKYSLIRFGKNGDGGYWVSKEFESIESLASFGIYDDFSFEYQLYKNSGLSIFMFDSTTNIKLWLLKLYKALPRLYSFKQFKYFYLPFVFFFFKSRTNVNFYPKLVGSKQDGFITINDIYENTSLKSFNSIGLKMDIEGSEYRVLDELFEKFTKIKWAVIEFHDFDLHEKTIINFINKNNLEVIFININNFGFKGSNDRPTVIELSLIKKEFVSKLEIGNIEHNSLRSMAISINDSSSEEMEISFV